MKNVLAVVLVVGMIGVVAGLDHAAAQEKASGEKIKLTYANFPPASTFPCVQMERWKTEVEKRTNGKVEVQTFPGGTLRGAKDMFDGVVSGIADIGNLAMSYQPGRFPVSEAVDLPHGFSNARVACQVLYDLIDKYQADEFKDVKLITVFTCPPSNFMTTKPVKSLEDLKGLELRCSGTGADVIKRLGGTPVAMPQSETPDAIQKGVVQGMVSSLEILKDFNFAAYCPYVTRADMYVVTFSVVMNKDKWESLPEDVKKVIDDMRLEQAIWTGEYVDSHVDEALVWAKAERDLQIFEFPNEDKAKIPELLKPMTDAYIQKVTEAGLPGKEIIQDVKTLQKKYELEEK